MARVVWHEKGFIAAKAQAAFIAAVKCWSGRALTECAMRTLSSICSPRAVLRRRGGCFCPLSEDLPLSAYGCGQHHLQQGFLGIVIISLYSRQGVQADAAVLKVDVHSLVVQFDDNIFSILSLDVYLARI